MSCSVFSLVLLTLVLNVCTIKGLCQTENCSCGSDLFYDSLSQRCIECPHGYIGTNCSIKCRFPSYGYRCQLKCNCSIEDCNASTGCPHDRQRTDTIIGIPNESDQEIGSFPGSKENVSDLNGSPDVKVTPVLISMVVVLIVILVAVVCRYSWRKYVDRRRKREVKHVEELLTFRHLGATHDNLYDLEELNGDVDNEKNDKRPESVDKTLTNPITVALKSSCFNETNEYFFMSNNSQGQNGDADEMSSKNEQGSETVDKTFKNLKPFNSDHSVETDKDLYENMCQETVDAADKEKDGNGQVPQVDTIENDYFDSLAFKVEKKKSCRDSQHLYDSLN